jgi:hypothetical protein
MSASTAVIPASSAREPRIPRCPSTLLTKPECHCRACLLELISTHGTAAAAAPAPRGGVKAPAPAPAGGIL